MTLVLSLLFRVFQECCAALDYSTLLESHTQKRTRGSIMDALLLFQESIKFDLAGCACVCVCVHVCLIACFHKQICQSAS